MTDVATFRVRLAARREQGDESAAAWTVAFECVDCPDTRAALEDTRGAWEAAWHGHQPSRRVLALLALADPEAELMPEYFAPGWQPFPTMTTTPAQAQMSVTYERVKRERAA